MRMKGKWPGGGTRTRGQEKCDREGRKIMEKKMRRSAYGKTEIGGEAWLSDITHKVEISQEEEDKEEDQLDSYVLQGHSPGQMQ